MIITRLNKGRYHRSLEGVSFGSALSNDSRNAARKGAAQVQGIVLEELANGVAVMAGANPCTIQNSDSDVLQYVLGYQSEHDFNRNICPLCEMQEAGMF